MIARLPSCTVLFKISTKHLKMKFEHPVAHRTLCRHVTSAVVDMIKTPPVVLFSHDTELTKVFTANSAPANEAMIHVDHHPSTISTNSNKNDILWSHQKPFTQDFLPQRPDNSPRSPTSLPDGNPTSPTRGERSSSLSPPPEPIVATSPDPRMALAEEKEAPLEVPQREEEEEEDPSLNLPEVEEEEELTQSQNAEEETNEKESRQSTPLSELSPPPDEPDDHDTELATDPQPADVESSSSPQPHSTSSPPKSAVDNTRSGSSSSTRTLRSMSSKSPTLQSHPQSQLQVPPKPLPPQPQQQQAFFPSTSSKHIPSDDHVTPSTITPTPALLQDPKVVSILELNVELLKCVFPLLSTFHFSVVCRLHHRHHLPSLFSITNDFFLS